MLKFLVSVVVGASASSDVGSGSVVSTCPQAGPTAWATEDEHSDLLARSTTCTTECKAELSAAQVAQYATYNGGSSIYDPSYPAAALDCFCESGMDMPDFTMTTTGAIGLNSVEAIDAVCSNVSAAPPCNRPPFAVAPCQPLVCTSTLSATRVVCLSGWRNRPAAARASSTQISSASPASRSTSRASSSATSAGKTATRPTLR